MKNITILFLIIFLPGLLHAQSLVVQSSNPADGAVNVALVTNISFTFNMAVDTDLILDEYEDIFFVEPYELVQFAGEPLFSNGNRTVTLPVIHLEQGDYIWFVFSAEGTDGTLLAAPYILRYTTTSQLGPWQVSGTISRPVEPAASISQLGRDEVYSSVSIKKLATPGKAERERLLETVRTHMSNQETSGTSILKTGSTDIITENGDPVLIALLFDRNPFTFDDDDEDTEETIRAAAIANADGTYSIPYVRNGEYYPVAFELTGDGIESAFGFYDPDETGMPASITVDGSNVSGINMTLLSFSNLTASEALEALKNSHGELIAGQDLISMITVFYALSPDEEVQGENLFWTFIYHDRNVDVAMAYSLFPFGEVQVEEDADGWIFDAAGDDENFPDEIDFSRMGTIQNFADSDVAAGVMEANGGAAYRQQIQDQFFYYVTLSAGNFYWLDLDDDLASERFVWKMDYLNFSFDGPSTATFYADMTTGEFISGTFTSIGEVAEVPSTVELMQNYPNPFNPSTIIPFRLDSDSNVRLTVYNMLGQEIGTLADGRMAAGEHRAVWDAGNLSSGIYLYRLDVDGKKLTRKMLLVK